MPESERKDALTLSREEMRALGYRVIDTLVDHFEFLSGEPPGNRGDRQELEAEFREPPPENGADPALVVARLADRVFRRTAHVNHPRFFAFVPSPGNFVGAMADALASGFNPFLGTWLAGSAAAEIELVTVDWLRRICEMPDSAGGLFVSGGSVANLTALAVARRIMLEDRLPGACVYYSDQTHSSVERALRILGFLPSQLRKLPSDEGFRLPLSVLRDAVLADRAAGLRPFCVVANAGTTNTGAVDPVPELRDFCTEQGLWLHADGAYGAPAMLTRRGRALLEGLGAVDSLSLDPHKWLFQPFEIGCVLVRNRERLRETFSVAPDYLKDAHLLREEVNFCDYGVQLTRSFRALKLWMSVQVFGMESFRKAVSRGFALAEHAEGRLRALPDCEIVSPAQLAIVAFRFARPGSSPEEQDALNQRLVGELIADGFAMLSSTSLRGRTALRFCTINPRTTHDDIDETVRRLERLASSLP